jgi:nitrogen-specific signal transduction histidine kinase/CheY-like chemotaxis protein
MCFVLDLSERRKTEAALRDAQKMESLGFLAGGVAHNLNNLLVGIMGNVSLVLSDLPGRSEEQERLESALTACERAAQLASELLAYAGKGHYFPAPLNLSTMIARDLRGVLRGSIPTRIDVRFELAPDLPELRLDSNQIQQVITNLTQNAVEAIDGRDGRITIRTEVRETAGSRMAREVVLSVSDTGIGMDEETQAKMFDPFFSTKFTGRGLGLAAVAGIVRACGGRIRVQSAPGRGSTFEVILPAGAAPAERKQTVLVVDDEPVVQQTVRATLERGGFGVIIAPNGTLAVEIATDRSRSIDLVLLDLAMPGMGGEETLDRLREVRPNTPVAICSGYPEEHVSRRFVGKNVQGYLKKPFTAQRLLAAASELTRPDGYYAPAP